MTKDEEIAVLREEVKILRSAWRALVIEKCQGEAPAVLPNRQLLSPEQSKALARLCVDPRLARPSTSA